MRFPNADPDRVELAAGAAEAALAGMMREVVEDVFGQKFGRGVLAFDLRHFIEVLVVQRLESAIKLAADPRLDALLAPAVAFGELPARLADILKPRSGVLCQLVSYS